MNKIGAVIVDMEGVVRDSRNAFHHAYEQSLRFVNIRLNAVPAETWKLRGYKEFNSQRKILEALYAIAKSKERISHVFWRKRPVEYVAELIKKHKPSRDILNKLENAYLRYLMTPRIIRRIPPVRAGKMGVKLLKADGFKIGVLTNSSREFNDKWIELKKMDKKFDYVMGVEDAGAPKPSPDGLIKLCKAMKEKPKNAVYVDDTEAGIIAAKAAGMIPIGIISGGTERRTLKALGATYVFRSMTEFALWIRRGGKF